MLPPKLEWLQQSKAQFEELRTRAMNAGQAETFRRLHNEIATALRDLHQALEKGEVMYKPRRPGGEVRHWVLENISVWYVVFPREQIGWILEYATTPHSWPN